MKDILIHMPTDQEALKRLQTFTDICITVVEPEEQPRTLPAEQLRRTQILFCDALPVNFEELTCLEWMQIGSVGYSHLYGLSLAERGVRVTNARGVFDVAIAEWCVAMMINLARDMPAIFRNQQQHVWDRHARFQSELRGRRLGVYGYGGIGRETARLAKSLGLEVWILTRGPLTRREKVYLVPGTGDPDGTLPDRVFAPDQKFEFLSSLDYLLLSIPLTPQTEGIIGEQELRILPETATILNPARGPLIQEAALLKALRENWIKGAALDTHYQYPLPPDHPLWTMENVILTPHISGSSASTYYLSRIWDVFGQNVRRYARGESLLNEVAASDLS